MPLDTIKLSVIIPLYNKSDTIEATLSSVLAQSIEDYEVVIVDDGSTDGSGQIVAEILDPRVRLIRQDNAGPSAARNKGVALARGFWIALVDADDLWSHDHLESLSGAAVNADVVLAFSNLRLESRGGKPLIHPAVGPQLVEDYFRFALAHGGYPASASSVLIRRDHLVASKLFTEGISSGEDTDAWCRLACRGPFFYTARPTATYRDLPQPHSLASDRAHKPVFPLFAEHLPGMIRAGEVPSQLIASALRYANFLLLEYARQLIDCNENRAARTVLLRRCRAGLDPKRYFKRLLRTWLVGRTLYRLKAAFSASDRRLIKWTAIR
jgi:glycosyltransferase involved in cell wall biosynthesis